MTFFFTLQCFCLCFTTFYLYVTMFFAFTSICFCLYVTMFFTFALRLFAFVYEQTEFFIHYQRSTFH